MLLLPLLNVCILAVVTAQDDSAVSYEGYQLLRVYPSTAQQLGAVTDLIKRRKFEGLVSLWSQQLIAGRTSGNNRTELSADVLSAPQVLEDLLEQLDNNGIPYDVLIHNLEVRVTTYPPRLYCKSSPSKGNGGKVVPLPFAYWGSGSIAPCIFDVGVRWR
jgi:hypothetical protein